MNRVILAVFLICFLSGARLKDSSSFHAEFVVWNIGQGQWTTWITPQTCFHYDIGGERDLSKKVALRCREKNNQVFLSHWDQDHVGLIKKYRKLVPDVCLFNYPLGKPSAGKLRLVQGIPLCPQLPVAAKRVFAGREGKGSNDTCQVFTILNNKILIPGDSTKQEEKIWAPDLSPAISGLVLGHHGSRSSSSELLLQHLPHLRWAVASARKIRYGHPHPEVVARLREHHIPLLKTEDWGSLHFLLE